jgi:ribonuclease III
MADEFETELQRVQEAIGYTFEDRALLESALTHKSYVNETAGALEDNQRLEFLGDAVLGLVVAENLMTRLVSKPEGVLTRWRAALVNEESLAEMARDLSLGQALRLGHGEQMNNGRDRSSTLSDAVEALLGAVFLDGGFDAAKRVIVGWMAEQLSGVTEDGHPTDAKGALQEMLQAKGEASPAYHLVGEEGPDHAKIFEVEISLNGEVLAVGRGRSKKEAEKRAARKAIGKVT